MKYFLYESRPCKLKSCSPCLTWAWGENWNFEEKMIKDMFSLMDFLKHVIANLVRPFGQL